MCIVGMLCLDIRLRLVLTFFSLCCCYHFGE